MRIFDYRTPGADPGFFREGGGGIIKKWKILSAFCLGQAN